MKRNAFTLVELIVGITISMFLMVGIGVFVSKGIYTLTTQEKILNNSSDFRDFSYNLTKLFSRIDTKLNPILTSSGVFIKQNKEFDNGGFIYIGTQNLSGVYCESDSGFPGLDLETKHIFIKSFIPFEEETEDMFSDFSGILISKNVHGYHTDQKLNSLIKNDDSSIVVGKEIAGDEFEDGVNGTDIYLNSPTGLASDFFDLLFISDTLNNRVLAYDTNSKKIYKLLDEKDGLLEPTGLYYNISEKALYIANSGRGEILKYSSKAKNSNPVLDISFSGVNVNVTNFKIEIFNSSNSQNITGPSSKSSFSFSSNINVGEDYYELSGNLMKYYFSNFSIFESVVNPGPSITGCTSITDNYYLEGETPKAEKADCTDTDTGSINKYNGDVNQNISLLNTYEIKVSDISPLLSSTGAYYAKLSLYDGNNLTYEDYFPYFSQGDNNLLTKGDNTLEVYKSGLNYPTGIWGTGDNDFREFTKNIDKTDRTFQNLNFDKNYDLKLITPVSSLNLDFSSQLLNLNLNYFKQYNCYNIDEKIDRNFILKKSYK